MAYDFSLTVEQQENFAFVVRFGDGLPDLLTDEPAPIGNGTGPDPARLLAAGVAGCLSASLLFALHKFGNEAGRMTATASVGTMRNEAGRLRIGGIEVALRLGAPGADMRHIERALAQFEDFCVVTQSVRAGIPVTVTVLDGSGTRLK